MSLPVYRRWVRWWRVFSRKKGKSQGDEADQLGPRRRRDERFPYEAQLTASCSSWDKVETLITSDVSAGGLYVPTDALATIGDTIELTLTLPDGNTFPFPGTVVNIITPEIAAKYGKRAGLGVRLNELTGEAKQRFDAVLAAAKAEQPAPAARAQFSKTGSLTAIHEDSVDELEARARSKIAWDDGAAAGDEDEDIDISVDEDAAVIRDAAPARPPQPAPPPAPPPQPPPAAKAAPPKAPPPVPRKKLGIVIGVDLGTSYTSVSAVAGKKVQVLTWNDGSRSSPSVISFPSEREMLIGSEARARLATDPKRTISSPKRLLGRQHDDREIQGLLGQAAWEDRKGPNGEVLVRVWDNDYAIPQLCSYLLKEAVETAERHLGGRVEGAVLTVPVSFDDARLNALRRTARMIGLNVMHFIDEPSAAALANRFDPGFGGTVGVFDFGGGTFDFSLVDVTRGDFQVMATAGDSWLGGDDFDLALADAAANQFWRLNGVDLRNNAVEWQRLLFACEIAKRKLSTQKSAPIFVGNVARNKSGKQVDLHITLDRPTFEKACNSIIQRSLTTCREALELLDMQPQEMTSIYLSGGTTYIPSVRRALENRFDVPVRTGVPPEHAVCLGAAIHAAQLAMQGKTTLSKHG